ncbi:nucleotidyltransferase [Fredinandcohnia quinoae]|uniref:tRNA(Met) cytidine acetate ligase n=1 Tax=Fredinandcohnia quinoae TaxID=2918902 RepID=A0AAW5DTC2_9BACI|nr:nucleotidyltransferase [Fredinandcohnia sp. SECRCQ15]MCH1623896.1 nucleotidyltransferase [Fredinandcohnia sp. SECRCQ15]
MKSVGVIVEYNPFHNGHKYHIDETRKKTNADCVVAIMSGNFLQRGEPALVSKWSRTKMALEAGIDIVIELPYAFATQKAETFANGAISLLNALHCDEVCFGSEHGTINEFIMTVDFMKKHQETFDKYLKEAIKEGNSYPKAASLAYLSLSNDEKYLDLSKPNNILGYHYVKAIIEQKSKLIATTIKRTSAEYHDEVFTHTSIASATSIRKALFSTKGNLDEIKNFLPETTLSLLTAYYDEYKQFHQWEDYFGLFKYRLLTSNPAELALIYEVEEGIENRLLSTIKVSTSFKDFIERIKTKRYTWTRLQRLCLHVLTHTTKNEMLNIKENKSASYIRLLGMSQKGQKYLNLIKKKVDLPIISKLSAHKDDLLHLDSKATQAYLSIFPEPLRSKLLHDEYSTPPIRYNEKNNFFIQ